MKYGPNKRFIFDGQRVAGLELTLLAISNSLLVMPNLLISMVILVPSYSFVCWLVSLTPAGTWIAAGLKILLINAQGEDLYKIGAAIGFAKSLLMRSDGNRMKRPVDNNPCTS